MRTPLVAAALSVLVVACIDSPTTSHIHKPVIGGEVTPEGEFPGIGALYLTEVSSFFCTGTLIAPDVVLTAGHCLDPMSIGSLMPSFTLKHDTTGSTPPLFAGAQKIVHENFVITSDPGSGPTQWYDIALLVLADPVTSVAPIKLPSVAEAATMHTGTQLGLVGYGVINGDGSGDGGVMYDALTDLVTLGDAELQISTPGAPQNCFGDSGGPALYDVAGEYRVVGVVSRDASGTGQCFGGGLDTRVDTYLDWINTHAPQVCIPGENCAALPDAAPSPDAAPAPDAEDQPDAADPIHPDAGGPGEEGDDGGCCSTSGGPASGSVLLAFAVGVVLMRRRRR